MGMFGFGVMNDNTERPCHLCSTNGLVITGMIFPHSENHKPSWRSPDGKTVDQPCCGEWAHENIDTKVLRGGDVYGDHYL